MIRDYELREELDRVAKEIHDYSSNPSTWLSWVTYLLAQLERQAMDVNSAYEISYQEMLSSLKAAIHNREQTGGW
jgi:hypothetical protein